MKSNLLYWHKAKIKKRYLLELKIHQVEKTFKYQDGVRYRLIAKDTKTERRVLIDNHHPKGHHLHIDNDEMPYHYVNEEKLIKDFKKIIFEHLGVRL